MLCACMQVPAGASGRPRVRTLVDARGKTIVSGKGETLASLRMYRSVHRAGQQAPVHAAHRAAAG